MFDDEVSKLPAGLESMRPGLALAAILASLHGVPLAVGDRLVVLEAHERIVSHYQALMLSDMVDAADQMITEANDYVGGCEGAAAEIRVALRLTRSSADSQLSFALELRERVPMVAEALSVGLVDVRQARVIADATMNLSVEGARRGGGACC